MFHCRRNDRVCKPCYRNDRPCARNCTEFIVNPDSREQCACENQNDRSERRTFLFRKVQYRRSEIPYKLPDAANRTACQKRKNALAEGFAFGALAFTVSRYFRCSSFSSGVSLRPCFTSFAISLFLLHCCRIDYERGQYRFCSGFPCHWFPVSCFHPLRMRRKYCVGHDVFFVKRNHYAPPRRQSLHR